MEENEMINALEKLNNIPKEEMVIEEEGEIPKHIKTELEEQMQEAQKNILIDAADNDKEFIESVKTNVKEAAVAHTEVLKKQEEYNQQAVDYESEKLTTKQELNLHEAAENRWDNKRKKREYHYDGVKPIMSFVDIKDPMNLIFLYFFTVILTPFFILDKIFKATFGTLLCGACDSDRPKAARGFIWTILAVTLVLIIVACIYLFLNWQGIGINIK